MSGTSRQHEYHDKIAEPPTSGWMRVPSCWERQAEICSRYSRWGCGTSCHGNISIWHAVSSYRVWSTDAFTTIISFRTQPTDNLFHHLMAEWLEIRKLLTTSPLMAAAVLYAFCFLRHIRLFTILKRVICKFVIGNWELIFCNRLIGKYLSE